MIAFTIASPTRPAERLTVTRSPTLNCRSSGFLPAGARRNVRRKTSICDVVLNAVSRLGGHKIRHSENAESERVDDIGVEIKPPELHVGAPNNLQSSR